MTAPTLPGNAPARTLDARLAREERALAMRSVAAALFAGAAIALVVLGLSALLLDGGRWLSLPRAVPVVAWLLGAVAAVAVALYLRRRDRQRLTRAAVASSIEQEQALRTGSLRGALEVASTGALGERAASDVAGRLAAGGSLAPRLERSFTRVAALTGGAALAGLALFIVSARSTADGMSALRHPVAAWRGMLLPPLGFSGLPSDVPRGMPLTLRIDASGRHQVRVRYSAAGESVRDTTVQVDLITGQATLALGPVTAPISVRISDGRSPDVSAVIAVADRGWIGDVLLFAEYPAYLGRTSERLELISPLRVPRGTVLRVRAMLRGGARDASMSNGIDTVVMTVEAGAGGDAIVQGRIPADRDSEWQWTSSPTSRDGGAPLPVEVPEALRLIVIPDQAPQVAIVAPGSDTAIGTSGVVAVQLQASDDRGLSSITLSIWKERPDAAGAPREQLAVAEPGLPMWDGGVTIPLSGRDLQPGDKLHVVAIATDNSPWRQATQSAEVILRVPSLSEQRAMARELADSLASRATQLAAAEKQLHQQTVDASRSRDMKGGGRPDGAAFGSDAKSQAQRAQEGALSAAAAERARELGRQQEALGERIDSLRQASKELEDRLKGAGALDAALQERMREVQRMLRDAVTPEMQKQLAELQKSTERLSGADAQQSLEQLAAQQQQMREQLEKSAEMLKRAALEGAMQTLRDEARELADAQQRLANQLQNRTAGQQGQQGQQGGEEAKSLADRSRALERDVDRLAKRLDDAGAKPGAARTKAAQPMVDQAADAMQRAAQQNARQNTQQNAQQNAQQGAQQKADAASQQGQLNAGADSARRTSAEDQLSKALAGLQQKEKDQQAQVTAGERKTPPSSASGSGSEAQKSQGTSGSDVAQRAQATADGKDANKSAGQQGAQQQGAQQQGAEQKGQPGQQGAGGQGGQSGGAQDAQQAASAMNRAAQQLADAREAQVDAWKGDLTKQLDQSINETQQLARQQAELEQRAKQEGASGLRGEQAAIQQGVQQSAERLEQAGRSSSLLSQRSQNAMGDAQRKVQQATQATGSSQSGGQEGAQSAMREATEALNQALGSLVRDRERVNNAQSASGFTEMMEQLRQLAQQQGSLNGQMQGLSMLPGGSQGSQAQQQARVLARQQREVARSLQDVSDADATGRTDALAKEAQQLAQQMERVGLDPAVAARQQQLYRRLLDAGRFLEQDERDDQGPREARSGSGEGRGAAVNGPASGRNANRFAPPTWNELRGLGPEERRLVIEYFRRINGNTP